MQQKQSLQGFQRTYLRGLAHGLKPVVQVGHEGVTEAVVEAVSRALLDHELIKVRLHEPEDKQQMANQLASDCDAHLCGLVGHTVILYRPHPDKPKITLPQKNDREQDD
jgi:RNA-binding protein